jgi:hypothetical protein
VTKVLNVPHTRRDHRIDWPGALALAVGLVPLLIVAEQGRTWGWTSLRALLCIAVGAVGLVAFVLAERKIGDDALLPLRFFRTGVFAWGSLAGFVAGMGMFGALALLPLYLQIVKGSTPTHAGLQTLPLVLGIMSMSILSGQFISRTGRYKVWPVVGLSLMIVGIALLSRIGVDTPYWRTALIMVVIGWGLGGNMQPLTLAVQNAMPPRDMGVATASATFFRQMGGTLGTAVFLSILFSRAADTIPAAYSAARQSPEFLAALQSPTGDAAANQQFVQGLQAAANGNPEAFNNALSDSSFLQRIDPRLAAPYLEGFSQAVDAVFLVGTFILFAAFVVACFLPHVELRSGSAYNERNEAPAPDVEAPVDAQLAPVGAVVGTDASFEQDRHNGSGPDGLPVAEDFAVPHSDKRGRHRPAPGEKLH